VEDIEVPLARESVRSMTFEIAVDNDINVQIDKSCRNVAKLKNITLDSAEFDSEMTRCIELLNVKVNDQLIRAGYSEHDSPPLIPPVAHDVARLREVIPFTTLFELANIHAAGYQSRAPFPYVYFDNLLPLSLLRGCAAEFPVHAIDDPLAPGWGERLNFPTEYRKRYLNMEALMGPNVKQVISFLKSSVFIRFLERLTGVEGLLADPHFQGGGQHHIQSGGMLKIHKDSSYSPHLRLWRRINVFVYLNEESEWRDDSDSSVRFGGELELWDADVKHLGAKVAPIMNRLFIMNSVGSFHGHPDPLRTPPHITRKSIAMYYYTVQSPEPEPAKDSTVYKPRPGERF
jgi:hypothetical protein